MTADVKSLPANICLHEASGVSVRCRPNDGFTIHIEGVHVEDRVHDATLILTGVLTVTRDGALAGTFGMELPDGEIFSFNAADDGPNSS